MRLRHGVYARHEDEREETPTKPTSTEDQHGTEGERGEGQGRTEAEGRGEGDHGTETDGAGRKEKRRPIREVARAYKFAARGG